MAPTWRHVEHGAQVVQPTALVIMDFASNLLGIRRKNKGLARTGVPRQQQPARMTAAAWASYAYQASNRAQQAEEDAENASAAAERHQLVAAASASQARAALLQAQRLPQASSVQDQAWRPYKEFCAQIPAYLEAHPRRASWPAWLRLRRFCGGFNAFLNHESKRLGPAAGANDLGFQLYDTPPEKYPAAPQWAPALPRFRAALEPQDSSPEQTETSADVASASVGPQHLLLPALLTMQFGQMQSVVVGTRNPLPLNTFL